MVGGSESFMKGKRTLYMSIQIKTRGGGGPSIMSLLLTDVMYPTVLHEKSKVHLFGD